MTAPEGYIKTVEAVNNFRDLGRWRHYGATEKAQFQRDLQFVGQAPMVTDTDLGNNHRRPKPHNDVVRRSQGQRFCDLNPERRRDFHSCFNRRHTFSPSLHGFAYITG